MRTTFAVGRLTPRSAEIVLLDEDGRAEPIPGPWKLEALVARLRTRRGDLRTRGSDLRTRRSDLHTRRNEKKKAEPRVH